MNLSVIICNCSVILACLLNGHSLFGDSPTNNSIPDSVKLFFKYILAETSSFFWPKRLCLVEKSMFFLAETDLGRSVP